MSVKLYIVSGIVISLIIGGSYWYTYHKGYLAGVSSVQSTQEKYKEKVDKKDVKIDKTTPFNADRVEQLEWLRSKTVRQ